MDENKKLVQDKKMEEKEQKQANLMMEQQSSIDVCSNPTTTTKSSTTKRKKIAVPKLNITTQEVTKNENDDTMCNLFDDFSDRSMILHSHRDPVAAPNAVPV